MALPFFVTTSIKYIEEKTMAEAKKKNLYNEAASDRVPIPFGVLPGHAIKLELKTVNRDPEKGGILKIYNVTYRISEKVADATFTHPITNKPYTGIPLIGREVKGKGIFFQPDTEEHWRNSTFKQSFKDGLGVKFPTEMDGEVECLILDRNGKDIEEKDIAGKPVLMNVVGEAWTDKSGVNHVSPKVGEIYFNPDEEPLSMEKLNDAPF